MTDLFELSEKLIDQNGGELPVGQMDFIRVQNDMRGGLKVRMDSHYLSSIIIF